MILVGKGNSAYLDLRSIRGLVSNRTQGVVCMLCVGVDKQWEVRLIHFKRGDIFTSSCGWLVNPVNCEGVMGAGLAKQFKERYLFRQKSTPFFRYGGEFWHSLKGCNLPATVEYRIRCPKAA